VSNDYTNPNTDPKRLSRRLKRPPGLLSVVSLVKSPILMA